MTTYEEEKEESRKKKEEAGWMLWKARTAEECLADWYDSDSEREQKANLPITSPRPKRDRK